MRLKKNIATSDTGFIFNPTTGDSFTVNPMASEILQYLKQGLSFSEFKNLLLQKYEVDTHQLENDCEDFLNQLKDANLLEA